MGEVLLYSIKKTVGGSSFSEIAHTGWVKIYSKILSYIIPKVVQYELDISEDGNKVTEKRFATMTSSTDSSRSNGTMGTIGTNPISHGIDNRSTN
jgi:hypothetical protein